jgi:hypothetical protein
MSRRLVRALCVACLPCLQCGATQIHGQITNCRGTTPLEGADVQLTTRAPGAEWQPEQTGSDGSYAFDVGHDTSVLPVTLTAAKKGYQSAEKVLSAVPAGATDVCLQPTIR